ncbi:putative peroxisome assembly protein 12 [Halichondria panicea]|uniref:putative peroxisome assembly protein 12 n=1 Tax=Halichondria panicea TaxID=6063 RepID=UPI00312B383A
MASFNEQLLESVRPNFFELVANEAMQEALRPAFQYISKVLVQSRPDLFNWLWRFSDELYTMLESTLQLYFLTHYGGSFSEQFYSLRRSPANLHGNETLGRRKIVLSLLCLCAVPYLKVKLDRLFSVLQEEDDQLSIGWWSGSLKYSYFSLYPYLSALWQSVQLLFRLRYLFAQTSYYSPLLWLAGVTLKRQSGLPSDAVSGGWMSNVIGSLAPLGVFSLKFLEWWYSSEKSTAVRMMTSLPVPPPPKSIQPSSGGGGVRVPTNPLLCPLCLGKRAEPTTIASSGYVFCYACILHYLRENHCCPITALPTTEKQIIRLFTDVS